MSLGIHWAQGTQHRTSALDLLALIERPAWHAHAACRGMDQATFYPKRGEDPTPARTVCARCPVAAECAEAGKDEFYGVWGGTTSLDRRMRRSLRGDVERQCVVVLRRAGRPWMSTTEIAAAIGPERRSAIHRALCRLAATGEVDRRVGAGPSMTGGKRSDMWRWNGEA